MVAYLGIVIAFIAVRTSNGQAETCLTSSGAQGNCISITDCSPLLNVLRNSEELPAAETVALRNSLCGLAGTTPKVCCPQSNPGTVPLPSVNIPAAVVPRSPPDVRNHPKLRLINDAICGPITETKIILGNKTMVTEFPWMALIGYKIDGQQGIDYQCGGTLINKRYVLTAGHCVTGLRPGFELAQVRLGDNDLSKERDCDEEDGVVTECADKYQDFSIEASYPHTNYRTDSQADDIALIRLGNDADLAHRNVKPICLPVGEAADFTPKKAVVTGWGRTEKGFRSQALLKVSLDIVPNDQCARVFQPNNILIGYKQLCAGGRNRKDSCAGDSGGPLQHPGNIGNVPKQIQYGTVSFGTKSCGVEGYPGVYTRVPYYMDWILNTITE